LASQDLFGLLQEKHDLFNRPDFIEHDPISVPHQYHLKQDIEIAGFLTATIAWGNRTSIIGNARRLLQWMDNDPYHFLLNAGPKDLRPFLDFVHRTFNGEDALFFITSLQTIFKEHHSLEPLFSSMNEHGCAHAISNFRDTFLSTDHLARSEKHIANPLAGSAAKRINMFLRWMVRVDERGVDFGIWKSVDPARLVCPLDIHVGRTSRTLGLLQRTQNDWKAAMELTDTLRGFDPADPVKYDFALFGMGISGW
jgi:uncharacterized protein (TIGR02757 family)